MFSILVSLNSTLAVILNYQNPQMKVLITTFLIFASFLTFGQSSYQEWETQAETNIRLKPKYGNVEKTKEQKKVIKNSLNKQ